VLFAVKSEAPECRRRKILKSIKETSIKMMNIKHNIHQEAFKTMPENMQNKINQSNGTYTHIFSFPVGTRDIKIYDYDTLSNKFYSNYTLSFTLVQAEAIISPNGYSLHFLAAFVMLPLW
jgi:hypothetical protein